MINPEMQELYSKAASFESKAIETAKASRKAFREVRRSSSVTRNAALKKVSALLRSPDWQKKILEANEKDLSAGKDTLSPSLLERLKLDPARIENIAAAVDEIEGMEDPVGQVVKGKTLPNGVQLIQKRVPLGVIFTVFESRPNVTVDVGALSVKSGNTAILRGGKEAIHTNLALAGLFKEALRAAGLPEDTVILVDDTDRALMLALLQRDDLIDLAVPRGGEGLIKFVNSNTRIPVVKHDKGVCTLFVDKSADYRKAFDIAKNAKLQRPSVCNSIENLIIHKDFPHTVQLLSDLKSAGAVLLGCAESAALSDSVNLIPSGKEDEEYSTEYLDNRLSVKMVPDIQNAIDFIYKYSSGHSEAIITSDTSSVKLFTEVLDSAALFVNCSTRFHDGGQMGMGAEVGISTQRLHVRGPMGILDLTTTTYILTGDGQVRS